MVNKQNSIIHIMLINEHGPDMNVISILPLHSRLHVGMGTDPRGLRTFGESRGIKTFAYGAGK